MEVVYYFDIASIILAILLFIIFLIRKSYPTYSRKLFKILIAFNALSAASELVICFIRNGTIHPSFALRESIFIIFYAIHLTLHLVFMFYVISSTRGKLAYKPELIVISIIYALSIIFVATNPLHRIAFDFDANGANIFVPGTSIIECIGVLSLVYSLILVIYFRKNNSKLVLGIDIFFLLMWGGSILFELFFNDIYVENFIITITVLLVTIITDNPEKYFFENTGVYNQLTFNLVYGEKLKNNVPFKIIAMNYKDFDIYYQKVGLKRSNAAIVETLKHFCADFGPNNVFILRRNIIIIDANVFPNDEYLIKECESVSEKCYRFGIERNPDCKLKAQFAVFDCPKDCDNLADLNTAMQLMLFDPEIREDNLVQFFNPKVLDSRHRREKIIMKIHEAIEKDGFEVYYQPLYDWKKDCFVGLEALIRFKDKEDSYSPAEFIPIAEQEGLIFDIDEIVFEKVCRFIRNTNLKQYGIDFVDVNLSLLKLIDKSTIDRYFELVSRYEIAPSFINLEITETAEANEKYLSIVRENISMLREKGFNISLDDYGSGYSTVVYMAEMDAKMVKIDASILWNAMKNKKYYTVLENCVRLIYCFDKECLCEGVENEEMVKVLKRLGVDYFQGFYYSKPINEEEIIQLLKKKNRRGSSDIKTRSKLI